MFLIPQILAHVFLQFCAISLELKIKRTIFFLFHFPCCQQILKNAISFGFWRCLLQRRARRANFGPRSRLSKTSQQQTDLRYTRVCARKRETERDRMGEKRRERQIKREIERQRETSPISSWGNLFFPSFFLPRVKWGLIFECPIIRLTSLSYSYSLKRPQISRLDRRESLISPSFYHWWKIPPLKRGTRD